MYIFGQIIEYCLSREEDGEPKENLVMCDNVAYIDHFTLLCFHLS